jgi:hypothetical protein
VGEVVPGFEKRKIWIDATMLLDERKEVVRLSKLHQCFRRHFGRRQLHVDAIGLPSAPVESAMNVAPNLVIFGAMESVNGIHGQEVTARAFARHFNFGFEILTVDMHRIRRPLHTAWAMIEMQVVSYVLHESRALSFKEQGALRTLLGDRAARPQVPVANGWFNGAVNRTRWKVSIMHDSRNIRRGLGG